MEKVAHIRHEDNARVLLREIPLVAKTLPAAFWGELSLLRDVRFEDLRDLAQGDSLLRQLKGKRSHYLRCGVSLWEISASQFEWHMQSIFEIRGYRP